MDLKEKLIYMKTLGIDFKKTKILHCLSSNVGILNGFFIYPQSYYFVVNGKIPLSMAEHIFNSYDNKKYSIRVGGRNEYTKPIDTSTSDNYQNYLDEIFECHTMEYILSKNEEMKEKRMTLLETERDSFYIDQYHIDTLEGLKIVTDYIKENNIKTEW